MRSCLLVSVVLPSALALTFELAPRSTQCLFTDLQKDEYMTADIFVKSGSSLSVNVKIDGPLTSLEDASPPILFQLSKNSLLSNPISPSPPFLHPEYAVHVAELVDILDITAKDVATPEGLTPEQAAVLSSRRVPKTYLTELDPPPAPSDASSFELEGGTYLKTLRASSSGVYRTCVSNSVGHFSAVVVDLSVRQSSRTFVLEAEEGEGAGGGGEAALTRGGHVPKFMYGASGGGNDKGAKGGVAVAPGDGRKKGAAKSSESEAAVANPEPELLASLKQSLADLSATFHELASNQERSRHRLDVHMATTESSRSGMVVGSVIETVVFMAVCFMQIWGVKKLFEGRGGSTSRGGSGAAGRAWA